MKNVEKPEHYVSDDSENIVIRLRALDREKGLKQRIDKS